jgi:hypothetical protein
VPSPLVLARPKPQIFLKKTLGTRNSGPETTDVLKENSENRKFQQADRAAETDCAGELKCRIVVLDRRTPIHRIYI